MIRSIWVVTCIIVLTAINATRVLVATRLRRPGASCLCRRLARTWATSILRIAGVKVRLEGGESIDWKSPLVVVANHQSWFDVFALASALPAHGTFVAKEELSRIPIFGPAWKGCGHISVDRGDRRKAIESLDRAMERIRQENRAVILFPEGTRSPDGRLYEFKKGAFVLALKAGVPVVPIGISGSRFVMPKGSYRIRPGAIVIRVGEPIPTARMSPEDRNGLMDRSRRGVAALMDDGDALAGA